jgi:hypothetical protein
MENLVITQKYNSPFVNFDAQSGILKIEGRAHPENADNFFYPIFDWIDKYLKEPCNITKFYINLEYFNSVVSKSILKLLADLLDIKDKTKLEIIWYYYDDDSLEVADDFQVILGTTFKVVSVTQ